MHSEGEYSANGPTEVLALYLRSELRVNGALWLRSYEDCDCEKGKW